MFKPVRSPDLVVTDINMVFENLSYWNNFMEVGSTFIVGTYKHFDSKHLISQVEDFLKIHSDKYSHEDLGYSSILRKIK